MHVKKKGQIGYRISKSTILERLFKKKALTEGKQTIKVAARAAPNVQKLRSAWKTFSVLRKNNNRMRYGMNILNIYFSSTGNTEKVALKIQETIRELGLNVETIKTTSGNMEVDILKYDFVFVGSGVYGSLPGSPLMELRRKLLQKYVEEGEVKPASPRRSSANVVVYCTYGGAHTGINEAIPAVKYMGQLFDHLGYTIVGEWYIVGEYKTEEFRNRSIGGRLGDIRGRPSEEDLRDVAEKVKGLLKAFSS